MVWSGLALGRREFLRLVWVSTAGIGVCGGAAACSAVIPSKLLAPMWEMGICLFSAPPPACTSLELLKQSTLR